MTIPHSTVCTSCYRKITFTGECGGDCAGGRHRAQEISWRLRAPSTCSPNVRHKNPRHVRAVMVFCVLLIAALVVVPSVNVNVAPADPPEPVPAAQTVAMPRCTPQVEELAVREQGRVLPAAVRREGR